MLWGKQLEGSVSRLKIQSMDTPCNTNPIGTTMTVIKDILTSLMTAVKELIALLKSIIALLDIGTHPTAVWSQF